MASPNFILSKEFAYGLLTDDFGILNKQDLKTNTCIAQPMPFSEKNEVSSSYPYWQCFEVKKSKMICECGKYDPLVQRQSKCHIPRQLNCHNA